MTPHRVITTILRSTLLLWVCCVVQWAQADTYELQLIDSDTRNKHIPVQIGGKEYLFTFDTGCSSMSVNRRLVSELKKQGLIIMSADAASNKAEVLMSNGETKLSHSLLIKSLTIGGCTFTNVVAQMGLEDKPNAPLLLGQSILERLRTYSITSTTFRFEPYEDDYQQALSMADYYWNDENYKPRIAATLLPYFREGRLSCFYTYKLLYVLQQTEAHNDALEVLEYIKSRKNEWKEGRSDFDLAEVEALLYYNIGVNAYNADRYDEALQAAAKTKAAAQRIADPQQKQKRLHNAGTLYWHIYSQTDPQKAKSYEQYKR